MNMFKAATLVAAATAVATAKMGPAGSTKDGASISTAGYTATPTVSQSFSTGLTEILKTWDTNFDDWIGLAPAIINSDTVASGTNTPTVGSTQYAVELSMVPMPNDAQGNTWTHSQFEANCDCDYKYLQTGILVSKDSYGQGFYEAVMRNSADENPFMSAFWLQGEKGEINVVEFVNKMVGNADKETAWNNYHCFDRTDEKGETTTDDQYRYADADMAKLTSSVTDGKYLSTMQTYAVNYIGDTVSFFVNGKFIRSASASCLVGQSMRVIFSQETNPALDGDSATVKPNTNPEDHIAQGKVSKLIVREFNFWAFTKPAPTTVAPTTVAATTVAGSVEQKTMGVDLAMPAGECEKQTAEDITANTAAAAASTGQNALLDLEQSSAACEDAGRRARRASTKDNFAVKLAFKKDVTPSQVAAAVKATNDVIAAGNFKTELAVNGQTVSVTVPITAVVTEETITVAGNPLDSFAAPVDDAKMKYLKKAGIFCGKTCGTDKAAYTVAKTAAKTNTACAALCAKHFADGCAGFAHDETNKKCELASDAGFGSGLFKGNQAKGWKAYVKKAGAAAPATTEAPAAGGVLAAYDAPITGQKGKYKKGKGNYKAKYGINTVEECATICSSAEHDAQCFAFTHKGTACDMHTVVGAGGTYTLSGASFYKKKAGAAPAVTTAAPAAGGVLAAYDAPVADRVGAWKKGRGQYKTDDVYATAAKASKEGCAAVCSSAEHTSKCFAFSFKASSNKCDLHTEEGAGSTRGVSGYEFYKKKAGAAPAVTTAAPAAGGVLAAYDAPILGKKGKYKKGKGDYAAKYGIATVAECATICSSAEHDAKCFAFTHKGTACSMHTVVGAGGTYTLSGASFYKKKAGAAPAPTGNALAKFASPVADSKGKWKKGAGMYDTDAAKSAQNGAKTALACATVCASAAHSECFSFAFKGTQCMMFSETGSSGAYSSAGTTGWAWYKKN